MILQIDLSEALITVLPSHALASTLIVLLSRAFALTLIVLPSFALDRTLTPPLIRCTRNRINSTRTHDFPSFLRFVHNALVNVYASRVGQEISQ